MENDIKVGIKILPSFMEELLIAEKTATINMIVNHKRFTNALFHKKRYLRKTPIIIS